MTAINKTNFYLNTEANFSVLHYAPRRKPDYAPRRKPDYVSKHGSEYWYDAYGVYRRCDHWFNNPSGVGLCDWRINGQFGTFTIIRR